MATAYFFRVAGLTFAVVLPARFEASTLLPSFRPFRMDIPSDAAPVFRLTVTADTPSAELTMELLGESDNDMGHVLLFRTAAGYRLVVDYASEPGVCHTLDTDATFSRATANIQPNAQNLSTALSSMLRILFAQAVVQRGGVSVHAAAVSFGGCAYLFLGRSGTGKSTHARQWLQAFPGSHLLNDDNPVLRLSDGRLVAYGTPWSGKTPCYRNEEAPVAGIVRLQQSPANRFAALEGPSAFAALLPSCSVIRSDARLQDALHATLAGIVAAVSIGHMECRPDLEAAHVCHRGILAASASVVAARLPTKIRLNSDDAQTHIGM
uniref:Phosphoenolpyruvate carboxykinase n=1 Tax=uncultured prokaryote TaxID=198431 RepID=A0A0H5PVP1_9ZZZZ|nr:hypothetical protein [uncultured prokaryote]